MHMSPARPRRTIRLATLGLAALAPLAMLAAAQPAAANPPGPHDPFGAVRAVKSVTDGIRFTGWAADPDALTTNVTVGLLLDGRKWVASAPTSVANATVSTKYKTGPTPGFSITAPVDAEPHTLCAVARNIDAGLDTVLKCVPTPLGTTLTATQRAAHDPDGRIQQSGARRASVHFRGWASDPDDVRRRAVVVLYLDGHAAATVTTHLYPAPRPEGAGPRSLYDIRVPVSAGTHIGCIWVVNVGIGSNAFQGCRARDTRGAAGTGTVTVPTLNKKVAREAKSHIGEPYVWGAEGPHKFDCSGLVMYSYGKFGYTTPRVSEDQARAARLIPASRAVIGDLAFYHDSVGDVYHVGIFLKPGLTVAAIDTDRGVDYQKIWDPSSTTYGSFTHK
jgi:cell wall-associated NlpC family hydrolase